MGAAAALAGCATTEPAAVLVGGPRMIDLYRGTAEEPADRGVPEAPRAPEEAVPEAPEGAVVEATCRWGWLRWRCEAPDTGGGVRVRRRPRVRPAANELELLFPRLPNPDVFIYVPAHLATELRIPVPGYTTAVPLYDRVEYALPGETEAARSRIEAPPGASPEEARRGTRPEEAGSGASPEEEQPGVSPEETRPDADPEEEQFDARPEEEWPGVNAEEAGPDAKMEEAP